MVKASIRRAPLYCSVPSVLHAWSHLGLLTACCHRDCSVPTSQGTMSQIQEAVLKKLMSDKKGLQKSRFLFSLKRVWNWNRWITISAPPPPQAGVTVRQRGKDFPLDSCGFLAQHHPLGTMGPLANYLTSTESQFPHLQKEGNIIYVPGLLWVLNEMII